MGDDLVAAETTSSASAANKCLVVAGEKKGERRNGGGGCVGVLFQLFDWNRRLISKKKQLSPKKLLLHLARSKQVSKRFIIDEKMPKSNHFPISEEKRGGFPSSHGDHDDGRVAKKREMRAPGVVARLMGLETMPAVQKARKSCVKGPVLDESNNGIQTGSNDVFGCGFDEGGLSMEKRSRQHDSRPRKIQKTLLSERHSVARFGADALQIRSALSRSRKHHCHKFESLVNSPRSGRSASRLMNAATRILEPGLQATSRAKCAIRYTNPMFRSLKDDVVREETPANHLGASVSSSLRRQASCTTCGNLFDERAAMFLMDKEEPPLPPSNVKEVFFQGAVDRSPPLAASKEKEIDVVLLKSIGTHDHYPTQARTNMPATAQTISCSVDPSREGPSEHPLQTGSNVQRVRALMQKEMLFGVDRQPPRIRMASEQRRKDPSMINRDDERSMSASKVGVPSGLNELSEAQRIHRRVVDPLSKSSVRKRRTTSVGRQTDVFGSASSLTETQRSSKNRTPTGAGPGPCVNSTSRYYGKTGQVSRECGILRDRTDVDVVSMNSEPTLRPKVVSQPMLSAEANSGMMSPQSSFLKNQDALGALLEKKLQELTWRVEEESATGIVSSTRTTASILQELIAAMTDAKQLSQGDTNADTAQQAMAWTKRPYVAVCVEGDHSSPGSVLGATFSNESCISTRIDDPSGNVLLHSDCIDLNHKCPSAYTDTDFLDSASSSSKANASTITFATQLLDHISVVLHNEDLAEARQSGTKHDNVKWVITNMVLLFGDFGLGNAENFVNFLLGPFLDELITYARARRHSIHGYEVMRGEKLFKRFVFDCLVECLELRYRRYWAAGFEVWSKLPGNMNTELLIQGFCEEVSNWILMTRKPTDEIIQLEMGTSLGKWTDFEIEGFEAGAKISLAIEQTLVDEVMSYLLCY